MSARNHKRKANKYAKKNINAKNTARQLSLFSQYPRTFLFLGVALILTGIYLLITGMQNHAKFGLAMLSIFAGMVIAIFANSALPKKVTKTVKQ